MPAASEAARFACTVSGAAPGAPTQAHGDGEVLIGADGPDPLHQGGGILLGLTPMPW